MIGLRFFQLKSADVLGAGTRDEPLRTSAWEASKHSDYYFKVLLSYQLALFCNFAVSGL